MKAKSIVKPVDVFVIRTSGDSAEASQIGEALQGKPNLDNDVAGMHRWDGDIPWGLEGKPGGVGWVDMRSYIGHPMAWNNCNQPNRTDPQRYLVASDAQKMLGTKYDWEAIGGDTLEALHVKLFHLTWPHGLVPGEVVCSSYWDYLYAIVGWNRPTPGDERMCEPADWTNFIINNNYHVTLEAMS